MSLAATMMLPPPDTTAVFAAPTLAVNKFPAERLIPAEPLPAVNWLILEPPPRIEISRVAVAVIPAPVLPLTRTTAVPPFTIISRPAVRLIAALPPPALETSPRLGGPAHPRQRSCPATSETSPWFVDAIAGVLLPSVRMFDEAP